MTEETNGARAEILRTRDFIGWGVTDANGAKVGTVSDLLIDRDGRVRFLAVDLGLFRKAVLVPVDALEWGDGALVLPRWSADEVKRLPPYDANIPLTRDVLGELERAHPRYYRPGGGPLPPPVSDDAPRIVPLREAKGFRLAKGAPNLRGWTVYGADNEKVGTVAEMLVDPVAMKIRYLDVDLSDDLFALKEDRHVLVPLEMADLRERGEDVWVKEMAAADIARLPAYTAGAPDPLVEAEVRRAFGMEDDAGGPVPLLHEDAPPRGDDYAPPPSDSSAALPPPSGPEAPPLADDLPADRFSGRETLGPPPNVDESVPPPIVDESAGPPPIADESANPRPLPVDESRPPIVVDDDIGPPPLPPEERRPDDGPPPIPRGG